MVLFEVSNDDLFEDVKRVSRACLITDLRRKPGKIPKYLQSNNIYEKKRKKLYLFLIFSFS